MWLVQFNPTKTKYMIFSKKAERTAYGPLLLQNRQLDEVSTHKHLGLTFNNKMTWDNHINKICTEAGKRLSTIKRLPQSITPLTKIHIYKVFIRPLLEYGATVFDSCTLELSQKLENVQRQATIAATRAYNKTSSQHLLDECGLVTLHNRRIQAKLTTLYKIKKDIAPDYLKTLLPKEVGDNIDYDLRDTTDIRLPKITKNY